MRTVAARRVRGLWTHRGDLVRFFRRRGVETHTADDLVATVYEIGCVNIHKIPDDDDLALAWLYRTAHFVLRNHWRSSLRQPAPIGWVGHDDRHLHPVPAAPPGILQVPAVDVDRLVARDAWASLSDRERALLTAVAVSGSRPDDVARALGCSVDATYQRVSRARAHLAELTSA